MIWFFYSGAKRVKTSHQSSLKISDVCVCVCVHACVYSGMPPNAGSVADPLLPYINPESIHLWAEPWNMFSSAENSVQ